MISFRASYSTIGSFSLPDGLIALVRLGISDPHESNERYLIPPPLRSGEPRSSLIQASDCSSIVDRLSPQNHLPLAVTLRHPKFASVAPNAREREHLK